MKILNISIHSRNITLFYNFYELRERYVEKRKKKQQVEGNIQ